MTIANELQPFILPQLISGLTDEQRLTFVHAVNLYGYYMRERQLKRSVMEVEVLPPAHDWTSGDLRITLDLDNMGDAALFGLRIRWHRRTVFEAVLLAKKPRLNDSESTSATYSAHVRTFETGSWQRQIATAFHAKLN